ncbi:MAG: O-antigen ligase family protein, partial [Planctomycetota bacterium]
DAEELMKSGGIDLQAKLQVAAWIGFGLLALRCVMRRRADLNLLLHAPLAWFVFYAATTVLSSVYSISPPLTLFRSGQGVIAILLVVSLRDGLNRLHVFIAMYLVGNWIFFLMANTGLDFGQAWIRGPDNDYMIFGSHSGRTWRLATPLGHPSQISIVGAAGAAGLLAKTTRRNLRRHLPLILFCAVTVLLTISRTAIAGMVVGCLIVLAARRRLVPVMLIGGMLIPLMVLIPSISESLVKYGMRGQSSEEFQSLTGRSTIYQQGLQRAGDALPLGEGFCAGRVRMIVAKEAGSSIVHSHNLFIESAVGMGVLGIVGAALVLITLAVSLCRVIRIPPNETGISPGWEPVAMAVPLLAFCTLDRGFASPAAPFLILFIALLALTARLLRDHHQQTIPFRPSHAR